MEVICFALGIVIGIMLEERGKAKKAPVTAKDEEIPPELLKQYEELFGYDGKCENEREM